MLGLERAAYSWKQLERVWQEHRVTTRFIKPLQQVDFSVRRAQSVARLVAQSDSDPEHSVALDAVTVLPGMNEHFVPVLVVNESWLVSIVYVPSVENLRVLALEALPYDDKVLNWARVHASVHVSVVQADVRQCAYVARVATSPSRCRPVLLPLRG